MVKSLNIRFGAIAVLVMIAGLLSTSQTVIAQSNTSGAATQDHSMAPKQETKVFAGKIVKSGDQLVLAAPAEKKTYQLDDQEKAQAFLDKNVKVTGILDSSSGIIHVSAIEPA